MFGKAYSIDKREFTRARLRDIQHAYKRFPAVFDDIGRSAIRSHGEDVIKDENPPRVPEFPCFVLSMNQELKAFTDQIVKRSLMIYTTTALPSYKDKLRHELHLKIQEVRRGLSTHLYREYLRRALDRFDEEPHPEDWLVFSSTILAELIGDLLDDIPPKWCAPVTWDEYADKRHERVKSQLEHLLRRATRMKKGGPPAHRLDSGGGKRSSSSSRKTPSEGASSTGKTCPPPSSTTTPASAAAPCSTAKNWKNS